MISRVGNKAIGLGFEPSASPSLSFFFLGFKESKHWALPYVILGRL